MEGGREGWMEGGSKLEKRCGHVYITVISSVCVCVCWCLCV